MTSPDNESDRLTMESFCTLICREVADSIVTSLAAGPLAGKVGFALVFFDVSTTGHMSFASNAPKADVLAMLDDLRRKLAVLLAPGKKDRPS